MLYAMLEFTGSCSQPCEPWRGAPTPESWSSRTCRHQLAVLARPTRRRSPVPRSLTAWTRLQAEPTDLDLLLRGLSELGPESLLLSQRSPGVYYDHVGVSAMRGPSTTLNSARLPPRHGVAVVALPDDWPDDDIDFRLRPELALQSDGIL